MSKDHELRLQRLESKVFSGEEITIAELSAREQSKRISEGKDKPHHIGARTKEVVQQELTSHIQNYQETFKREEKIAHAIKKDELIAELQEIAKWQKELDSHKKK